MEIKADSEISKSLSKSVVKFTNDTFKVLLETSKENYICSTFSAHMALSMAAYGAEENTAVEMRKVLCISEHDSDLLEYYQRIIDYLKVDKNVNDDESCSGKTLPFSLGPVMRKCIVTLANKIIISHTMNVNEDYKQLLSTYFRSESETFDFEQPEESAQMINTWCSEITDGKIRGIVHPDQFTGDTGLLLINAVYFKGWWETELIKAVEKPFYLDLKKNIDVPTMYIKKELQYRELPELNAKSVRLNFREYGRYMEFIIPNSIDGLETIVKNLDKIGEKQFYYKHIRFWLPKFEVQSIIQFENYLMKMGMVDAFDEGNANFNKISPKNLHIKSVLQKAYIKVDEIGCEAAAITIVELVERCGTIRLREPEYITIKADRPFLFRIMDSKLNIPLFIGTVVNPLE